LTLFENGAQGQAKVLTVIVSFDDNPYGAKVKNITQVLQ
jgi:hypothetical protein